MIRLLADEQFPMRVVDILRRRGYDVETVRQTCESKYGDGLSDDVVLEYAILVHRVILTLNRSDFETLHKKLPWHAGIVSCPYYPSSAAVRMADRIHAALCERTGETGMPHLNGQLMRLRSPNEP